MSDFDDGLGPHDYNSPATYAEEHPFMAWGELDNGVVIGEYGSWTEGSRKGSPFGKRLPRPITVYWASCPLCGWKSHDDMLPMLRRLAKTHDCGARS